MAFKRYNLQLLTMILLVVITSFLLGWAAFSTRYHIAILCGFLLLVETVSLFLLITHTNRKIIYFFKALKNNDTSIRYQSTYRDKFINELHRYLDILNSTFREMKIEYEIREQYFSKILENLSSGWMVLSKTGYINQINQEALRLLNIPHLTHIKALENVDRKLYARVAGLGSLDNTEVQLINGDSGSRKVLGLQAVELNLKGEVVKIITIQDLSAEMERKEIDDWIRLIRVMSHEIMNSLAPITSLSTTLKEIWSAEGEEQHGDTDPRIQQTLKGLDAIAEQSEGLTTFFESYRVLSRIPDPVKSNFSVSNLLEKLETLVVHNKEYRGISFEFGSAIDGMILHADEQMVTQVMLNLIKNAAQALKDTLTPRIDITAPKKQDDGIVLCVTDNGPGIPPEISSEIFMPFFTTRKKGTGVGLSYSRQVMAMHGGTIEFDSKTGLTEFRLIFPA